MASLLRDRRIMETGPPPGNLNFGNADEISVMLMNNYSRGKGKCAAN